MPKGEESSNFAHLTNVEDIRIFLLAMEKQKGDYAVKMALKFQTLVFLRPYNVRFLKWEHVDLDNKMITIPAEDMKMKRSHKVPLSIQALTILSGMLKLLINYLMIYPLVQKSIWV